MKISLLVQIMGESAFKWMSDQLAQTVLPLERLLDGIPQQFPAEIRLFLKRFFEKNRQAILTKDGLADWKNIIIGISTQLEYNRSLSGKNAAAQVGIYESFTGNVKQFSKSVNNGLLDSIYDTLNLSVEARSQIDRRKLFETIPFDQFAALARARKSMGDSHPHADILEELINCYLTGSSICDFLHNPHQASSKGTALASHNANIRAILTSKNINPELALHYPKTFEFSHTPPGFEIAYERSKAAQDLYTVLSGLLEKAVSAKSAVTDPKQTSQFDSIIKGLSRLLEIDAKTGKLKIDPQKFYEQQNFGILDAIQKNISALGKNKAINDNPACKEFLISSADFTKQFDCFSAQKTSSDSSLKSPVGNPAHFRIEQWDKEKISTLFLGNEVDCCLAVGSGSFPAIVQRIMDDSMLFHVVVDLETQKPIALTWLYLATDQNGDINLVGNFVEIKAKYGANEDARETIVNALMHYSGEMYCRDNPGIKGFIINELTYGWNAGKIPFREKPVALVDKVGGAFAPDVPVEERARQGKKLTCDRYYLRSLERTLEMPVANFHIYDPKQLTAEQRQKFSSVEEKIFQIVNKYTVQQKELKHHVSNEELIRIIDPLVRSEVNGKMGAFFDDSLPEKLSSVLDYAYRVVIFREPRHESPLFSPDIDELYPDSVTAVTLVKPQTEVLRDEQQMRETQNQEQVHGVSDEARTVDYHEQEGSVQQTETSRPRYRDEPNERLMDLAIAGDIEEVSTLFSSGATLQDEKISYALMLSANHKHWDVLAIFLSLPSDRLVVFKKEDINQALLMAVAWNKPDIVQKICSLPDENRPTIEGVESAFRYISSSEESRVHLQALQEHLSAIAHSGESMRAENVSTASVRPPSVTGGPSLFGSARVVPPSRTQPQPLTIESLKSKFDSNAGGFLAKRDIFKDNPSLDEAISRMISRLEEKIKNRETNWDQGATYKTLQDINRLPAAANTTDIPRRWNPFS